MPVDALTRHAELAAKVDAFFARVHARHRSAMHCAAGCTACCRDGLTVTLVEAAHIAAYLAGSGDGVRDAARASAARGDRGGMCAALGRDGRCLVYAARPLVCRSHGAPIRRRPDGGGLPVIDSCELNFDGGAALAQVAEDDVIDQQTLSTMLAAVDAAFADEVGAERGTRIALRELLGAWEEIFGVEGG